MYVSYMAHERLVWFRSIYNEHLAQMTLPGSFQSWQQCNTLYDNALPLFQCLDVCNQESSGPMNWNAMHTQGACRELVI